MGGPNGWFAEVADFKFDRMDPLLNCTTSPIPAHRYFDFYKQPMQTPVKLRVYLRIRPQTYFLHNQGQSSPPSTGSRKTGILRVSQVVTNRVMSRNLTKKQVMSGRFETAKRS